MKLLIASLGIVCAVAFAQDLSRTIPDRAQAERDMQKLRLETRLRIMKDAISQHQAFQLRPLGPKASVTAAGSIGDDGQILRLADVEIRTDSLIVQADEIRLHWDTGEIEPVGNVRVKPIPQ